VTVADSKTMVFQFSLDPDLCNCSPCSSLIINLNSLSLPFSTKTQIKMDYEGQKLAELLFYWIIIAFGGIGWVVGYFQQDFFVVVQAWFVGVVISVIVSTVL
jgi:hypothetical protein